MDEVKPETEVMGEHAGKSCCGKSDGCRYRAESEEKGSWIVAGAVLLSGLMVAASILVSMKPGKVVSELGATDTAAQAAQPRQPARPTVTLDQVKALFNNKNITFGNKNSKVLFVEFSDPSCPYCHIAAGKNSELNKQAGSQYILSQDGGPYLAPVLEMKKLVDAGKAAFVWMYANGHGNGEMATKALYCAHEKGKFWAAHDLLMSNAGYTLLNDNVKNDIAKASVLAEFLKGTVNPTDMQACLESGKYDDRLTSDMAAAQQLGFGGTPAFFINETYVSGAQNFKDMQATVDKYLK